jgi:hypothetical protein
MGSTKTVTSANGGFAIIDPNGSVNRRVYITGIRPYHHRTEIRTGSGGDSHWKDVLGVSLSGVVLGIADGEGDQGKIQEYERKDLTRSKILDARNACDAYNAAHGTKDCVV